MKQLLFNFCAFCLILVAFESNARTNIKIIDSLLYEATNDIVNTNKKEIKNNVVLQIGKLKNNLSGYLRNQLGNNLTRYNYNVFRNFPHDTTFQSTVFEISNCRVQINYSQPNSFDVFKEAIVKREIKINIEGQVYNSADNHILTPIQINKEYSDSINYDQIESMEESPYPFTYGQKTDITGWQKIIEPAIVISSVVVVVLLLFTQRS